MKGRKKDEESEKDKTRQAKRNGGKAGRKEKSF
jgi:hypothetical protein